MTDMIHASFYVKGVNFLIIYYKNVKQLKTINKTYVPVCINWNTFAFAYNTLHM